MTYEIKTTGFAPTYINNYVNEQLSLFGLIATGPTEPNQAGFNPMVPAQYPTSIEDLYNDTISIQQVESPILIVYDRMMRFRPTPFYRRKREQLIYFIYSSDVAKLINSVRIITDALDREDAAAQDVNAFSAENATASNPANVYFHNIRVYQVDESRDVAELASARTLFVNKVIVEYDYHIKDTISINGTNYTNPYS
jgi:hypothetical protein